MRGGLCCWLIYPITHDMSGNISYLIIQGVLIIKQERTDNCIHFDKHSWTLHQFVCHIFCQGIIRILTLVLITLKSMHFFICYKCNWWIIEIAKFIVIKSMRIMHHLCYGTLNLYMNFMKIPKYIFMCKKYSP